MAKTIKVHTALEDAQAAQAEINSGASEKEKLHEVFTVSAGAKTWYVVAKSMAQALLAAAKHKDVDLTVTLVIDPIKQVEDLLAGLTDEQKIQARKLLKAK